MGNSKMFASSLNGSFECGLQSVQRYARQAVLLFLVFGFFAFGPMPAQAAITEQAPVIDAFFENNPTIGGGAILPLAQFRLSQSSGSETLTKIGVTLVASSTMANGSISRLSLWKESGTKPGFQLDNDTFVAGAASTTVTTGLLTVLTPTTAVSIDSTGVQFYVVASTTAVTGLTNGHGFHVQMDANYASTSASTGIGTAFTSNRKVSLNQSSTLKISEVRIGGTDGAPNNEFVELYNSGEADINLADLPLAVHKFYTTGSSSPISITYEPNRRIIPSHGYFLLANQSGYNGTSRDAYFATTTFNVLVPNGGFSIATSSTGTLATSTAIDRVGWGDQPTANCENVEASSTPCVLTLTENGNSIERLATGYPTASSTAATMTTGGIDATKGNGFDKNFNKTDFALQTAANPQNRYSPVEFPFGGGMTDTSTFQVQGAYPTNGQTGVEVDRKFFGFNLNKTATSSTITSETATTTVTLFKVASGAATGSNLCSNVTYNPESSTQQAKCNITSSLEPSTSYVFTVTSAVRDLSGNSLDQDAFTPGNQNFIATSTTGVAGQTFTNVTPPAVMGTSPFNGTTNIPSNLTSMAVEFSTDMMPSTITGATGSTTIALATSGGASVAFQNFSFSTSTGKNILSMVPGTLAANTTYILTITGGAQSTTGINLASPYSSRFTTGGSGGDTSAPTVVGVNPPTTSTTISAATNDFKVVFDDALDTATATSGAVTLAITGGPNLPGSVRYDPVQKEVHFVPTNILPVGQGLTLTIKGASIKNASGVYLTTDITKTWTIEASNSDTTGPSVLHGNVDEFSVAVTFNEAVNSTDATNLDNYSLVVGGVTQTPSALAGHTVTYDASTRTARLSGLRLTAGASVTATVSNIKDITGNLMSGSSSAAATVSSATGSGGTGGFVGPGSFTGSTFGDQKDFSSAGIGFMPPVNIRPSSTFISASSTYAFELPISKQIDANGTIVVTFPSDTDFGFCCVATTSTKNPFLAKENKDINGPSTGTIGIKTIVTDSTAKTVTITVDTATRSENSDVHDFLRFSLADIKNTSIPKGIDSSGYSVGIKSKSSAGTLLESFNANPVYITGGSAGGGQTTTIRGTVSGNGGNLVGVTIHLMSPQTGPLDATTGAGGAYSFADLPIGSQFLSNNFGGGSEYYLFTDPYISGGISDANGATTTEFFGITMPTPIQATSTSLLTRDFALTRAGGSGGITFTVNLSAAASTFTSTETVDVFAGGPGQFVVKTVTPGAALLTNATLTTIPLPKVNGSWGIGIGPAMPKGTSGGFSGPPEAPSWSPPRPIELVVSGCPDACTSKVNGTATTSNNFTISVADKSIVGKLQDGTGNAIANAMVFAYSGSNGIGSHAETSSTGAFTVKVVSGSYVIGSFSPGVGKSREIPVVVASNGDVFADGASTATTSLTLRMTKPSYTITGQVTDGSSAVGNAPVFAYQTNGQGHADGVTDSSTGNYTIYVDNGTWKVNSFIPGFGPMTEQTVVVSGGNQSNINFSPSSSASFSLYTGNIYDDADNNNIFATSTEGLVGAVIRLSGASGTNEGVSGADGAFSIRVPSGTGYTITDVFMPGYGRIAPLNNAGTAIGTLNLTASSTNNYIRVPKRNTITINVKDSNGAAVTVQKAFIDLFNTTTKQGAHVEITNATTTTIQVATGTSPAVRAYVQGVPPSSVSVASDDTGTTVSSGVVTIDNATEAIKIVVNTSSASFSQISGKVYKTSATSGNELDDAWIQFIDETNGVHFGAQATSSGAYSVNASNGTYQVIVSKSGYIGTPETVTVSGTTTKNFILDSASLTISGTVTAGGSAAANAFVRAEKVGGGQAIGQTDTAGAYSLSVTSGTWKVFATAEGYKEGASASNPIVVSSSVTGANVALSTTVSLQSKLATSNTFTDTAAGSFTDSTVGVNIDLDSNALGAAGNSSYLTAKETSNIPETASVNIVADKAKDINAYSGGSQIKNLQSGKTASVDLTYTKSELAESSIDTTTEVGNLKMVSYSEDKKEWEALSTVATYLDSSGDTVTSPASNLSNVTSVKFTAVGTHFSAYALSSPTGAEPPSTPSGLTATAGSGVGASITVTWSASSGAEGYYLYRDTSSGGSFALYQTVSGTSYTDSNVSGGTTYYYKISAYADSGSQESAASSAVNATSPGASGGGSPGSSGGGGGGASSAPPARAQKVYPDGTKVYLDEPGATAKIAELDAKFAKPATVGLAYGATPTSTPIPTSAATVEPRSTGGVSASGVVFSRDLARGTRGEEVKKLQELLGVESTGFFGPVTEKALKTFQVKNGVVRSESSAGAGKLGPATRAKIAEVFSETVTVPSATPGPSAGAVGSAVARVAATAPTITRRLASGSRGDDVTGLQKILATDPDVYPEGDITGFFGGLTKKAVERFQEKYDIAKPGDEGYGSVGPKTRAKLNELAGSATPATPAVPATPGTPATPAIPAIPASVSIISFTKPLKAGARSDEVRALQQVLNADPDTRIAAQGDGSPGSETTFFGAATRRAVGKFQEKHGLAKPGDEGYGAVGPKTRAKLNELLSAGTPEAQLQNEIDTARQQIQQLEGQLPGGQ